MLRAKSLIILREEEKKKERKREAHGREVKRKREKKCRSGAGGVCTRMSLSSFAS